MLAVEGVLARYTKRFQATPRAEPLGNGLINDTFAISAGDAQFVLQRINAIFSPRIHENIHAVTQRLEAQDVATPVLCRTDDEELWVEQDTGVWRLMTRLRGVSFDVVADPPQAAAAARALGHFHRALDGLKHDFVGMRFGVHDTVAHLQHLADCLAQHRDHRLYGEVEPLADEIFEAADSLPQIGDVQARVVHGDPKFNNVLFEGTDPPEDHIAVGLVDLDTVGPMPLHLELGDAWRSWCNPSGEDAGQARFDLSVFEASVQGWAGQHGLDLSPDERDALPYGVDWITVELAARFLADALAESYFGYDADRFATRGDHNLVRARGQLALHKAVVACRSQRSRILSEAL